MSKINLGENLDILCGFAFSSAYFNSDKNGIPLVRIRDLLKNEIDAYYAGEYEDRYLIKKDDLLIGMDGDFNITTWDREIALLNQRVLRIREKKNSQIDQRFIYFWLIETLHEINRKTSGTTVKHLSTKDVTSLTPDLPDKPEQKAIATVLDTVDEAIQSTQAMLDKQDKIKQGLLHDLLTRGVDERGHLRPAPETAPDIYQQTEVGLIPKEWTSHTFEHLIKQNIIDSVQDGNHGEIHPKSSDFVSEGIPFVMANNIDKFGDIDIQGCHKITRKQYLSLRIGFSKPDDILLTHKGTIGRVGIVKNHISELMLTPQVTYYRIKNLKKLMPEFLFYFFQSPLYQRTLLGLSAQSTRNYIGITQQKELFFTLIPIEEQKFIVASLKENDQNIFFDNQRLIKLKNLKAGLMQDLLTGHKRVTPALMRDVEKLAEAA